MAGHAGRNGQALAGRVVLAQHVHVHEAVDSVGEEPLLGRVLHWVVRYEAQVRCGFACMGAQRTRLRLQSRPAHSGRRPSACLAACARALLQHRGSLHAHILLWIHPDDLPQVSQEITASRCRYKWAAATDGTETWLPDVPEDDATAHDLYRTVLRKQMHTCRSTPGGCKHHRLECRYGFPCAANRDGTKFDAATNRCGSSPATRASAA